MPSVNLCMDNWITNGGRDPWDNWLGDDGEKEKGREYEYS
jgi:hypothetical protein